MMDSCRPRKLDPGLEAQYSMPSDLMTSTMKSAPGRWLEDTSAVALVVSGLRATCCAMAIGGLPTSPAAPAAAAAPRKKPRRSRGFFFDMHCLLKRGCVVTAVRIGVATQSPDLQLVYNGCIYELSSPQEQDVPPAPSWAITPMG